MITSLILLLILLFCNTITLSSLITESSGSSSGSINNIDQIHMNRAITLASQALGQTSPNPCVGCVIVDQEGNVIGEGYHHKAGQSHAEVLALKQAGAKAKGSTAYVSLEPCNHYGRTPPCTLALIDQGITRVVIGMVDPDPRVSGTGVNFLKDHGINVNLGIENEKCKSLNRPFIYRVLNKRPLSVVWALLESSEDIADRLNSRTRRIDIVVSKLTSISPEVDSVVFHVDDFVEFPNEVLNFLPSYISIIILGMNSKDVTFKKAVERIHLEDDVLTRKWVVFLEKDNDMISTRDNVKLIGTDTAHVSGNYFTRLLSKDILQKIASLGSNAMLLIATSVEELTALKRNNVLQKLVLVASTDKSSLSHRNADAIIKSLTNEELVSEVKTSDDYNIFSYNFWK